MRTFHIGIILVTLGSAALGGDRNNVRGTGMARTMNAIARRVETIGINPANLGIRDRGLITIGLMQTGVGVSSEVLTYDIYQEYFTGVDDGSGNRIARYLTNADKEKILGSYTDDFPTSRIDAESMEFALTITPPGLGGFGFAMIDHAGGEASFSKDAARFFLYGLDSLGSRYSLDGSEAEAWWWRELNVSYGMKLPVKVGPFDDFYGGLGFKIVQGIGVFETVRYNATFANERVTPTQYQALLSFDFLTRRSGAKFLDPDNENNDFFFFPDPAGTGVGFDLGATATMKGMMFSLALTDLGSITWKENVRETYANFMMTVDDPFNKALEDSIKNAFKGENRVAGPFSTSLPARLRLGFAVYSDSLEFMQWLPGSMLFAFDYNQGLNSSMGNITAPRFSMGVEYRLIPFIPIRTGVSFFGDVGVRWGFGFGLDFYFLSLDFATENFAILYNENDLDLMSVSAGLQIRI